MRAEEQWGAGRALFRCSGHAHAATECRACMHVQGYLRTELSEGRVCCSQEEVSIGGEERAVAGERTASRASILERRSSFTCSFAFSSSSFACIFICVHAASVQEYMRFMQVHARKQCAQDEHAETAQTFSASDFFALALYSHAVTATTTPKINPSPMNSAPVARASSFAYVFVCAQRVCSVNPT